MKKAMAIAGCVISISLFSTPFKASAAIVYFIGQVLENTPAMAPVVGANVEVIFEGNPPNDPDEQSFFPEVSSPLTATTQSNGLFVVTSTDAPSPLSVFYNFANVTVGATSRTHAGTFNGNPVEFRPDLGGLLGAGGITLPNAQNIVLALLEGLSGVSIPVFLSTDFVAIGGANVFKVNVKPACILPAP